VPGCWLGCLRPQPVRFCWQRHRRAGSCSSELVHSGRQPCQQPKLLIFWGPAGLFQTSVLDAQAMKAGVQSTKSNSFSSLLGELSRFWPSSFTTVTSVHHEATAQEDTSQWSTALTLCDGANKQQAGRATTVPQAQGTPRGPLPPPQPPRLLRGSCTLHPDTTRPTPQLC